MNDRAQEMFDAQDEDIPVALPWHVWASVCGSLQEFLRSKGSRASRADASYALREIDRVMRGDDRHAPLDELMPEQGDGADGR
jgi:hypothetical protein